MTDQTDLIERTGIHAIMDDLRNMPLPDSHKKWNKTIFLQVVGHDELCYEWIIRDGQWTILEGRVQAPDLILRGDEAAFIKTFTGVKSNSSQIWIEFLTPNGKNCWPMGDSIKGGLLIGNISMRLNEKSSQLLAEAEQRPPGTITINAISSTELAHSFTIEGEMCPKCGSRNSASQTYYFNPTTGEKIPSAVDSKTIGILALVGGILILGFGLFLAVAIIVGLIDGGYFPVNIFFAISATFLVLGTGLSGIREGNKIIKAFRQQQGLERINEYTCNSCNEIWKKDNPI